MSQEINSQEQENNFSVFGFNKLARRNFVIAIISIQFIAIGSLFRYTMVLNDKINNIRSAQVDSSNAMYNRLVNQIAEKMKPVADQVQSINENIAKSDSLQYRIINKTK